MNGATAGGATVRAFLRAGCGLVPIPHGQKGPRAPRWHERANAVFGEEQAERFAGLNAGLAHAWSRTCALDVDDMDGADAWLSARGVDLTALFCQDGAVSVSSGRPNRGKLVYRLPDGVGPLTTHKVTADDGRVLCELRCAASSGETVQDVIAGRHPDGGNYTVSGDVQRMPALPDALLALWRSLEPPARPYASHAETRAVPISDETRADLQNALQAVPADSYETWIAVGHDLYCLGDVGRELWDTWSRRSDKYEERAARDKWASFQRSDSHYKRVFTRAEAFGWRNPARAQKMAIEQRRGVADDDAWPEPRPLYEPHATSAYPIEALPNGIREAVAEVVGFVQCPVALAACAGLSSLSLSGQGLANVERANGLQGPISLYLLAIADSGERKTTCDQLFLKPVREWEREQAERAQPDLVAHRAAHDAWDERRVGIKTRIREAARSQKESDAAERELLAAEADEPKAPRVPRLIHGDATPEALAWSLSAGWPSGGVMSSEAGIVFGGHGMGRDSVMRNLSLLNALWDGATHRVERRTSESFTLSGARLTMGLAAQPETVRQFMEGTKGLARGNGFAARFLIAAPESTQGTRRFVEAPAWRYLDAFSARLRELLAMPLAVDEAGGLILPVLAMTPEARAAWICIHDDIEAELRPGGDMAEVRDIASKAADNVARLAALFHLYAHGPTGQIGADCIAAAAKIVTWHLYQARAFLSDVAAPREVTNARRLDAWLLDYSRREGVHEVERRTIQQRGPNVVRGTPALNAALAELADADRIREVVSGRRKLVLVNPALQGAR
jgi:putative DNA primase/helicase